jgi:hypothetical protein
MNIGIVLHIRGFRMSSCQTGSRVVYSISQNLTLVVMKKGERMAAKNCGNKATSNKSCGTRCVENGNLCKG